MLTATLDRNIGGTVRAETKQRLMAFVESSERRSGGTESSETSGVNRQKGAGIGVHRMFRSAPQGAAIEGKETPPLLPHY